MGRSRLAAEQTGTLPRSRGGGLVFEVRSSLRSDVPHCRDREGRLSTAPMPAAVATLDAAVWVGLGDSGVNMG